MFDDPKPWFAPKAYGFGAGLPIAWQGWFVLLLFIGGMLGAAALLEGVWRPVVMTFLVIGLVLVASRRTDGGWRWRWKGR